MKAPRATKLEAFPMHDPVDGGLVVRIKAKLPTLTTIFEADPEAALALAAAIELAARECLEARAYRARNGQPQ